LETKLGVRPPRWLQIDFSRIVQSYCDDCGTEVSAEEIWKLFRDHCLRPPKGLKLHNILPHNEAATGFSAVLSHPGEELQLQGNVLEAEVFVQELADALMVTCDVLDCSLQSIGNLQPLGKPQSLAIRQVRGELPTIAYIRLKQGGECFGGVAIGASQAEALVQAALSALGQIVCSNEDEATINLEANIDLLPRVLRVKTD